MLLENMCKQIIYLYKVDKTNKHGIFYLVKSQADAAYASKWQILCCASYYPKP